MCPALSPSASIETIGRLAGLKILVLGDLMLDVYDFCRSGDSRSLESERPGKRAYRVAESVSVPGAAGNVAANLASMKADTTLISLTGNDGYGYTLRGLMKSRGVRFIPVREAGRPTTLKMRIYIDDEYMLRRDSESVKPIGAAAGRKVLSEFRRHVKQNRAVILSDYNKGFFEPGLSQSIIRECRHLGIPVIVDFKPANLECFRNADVIIPNRIEAEALSPGFSVSDLERSMRTLAARTDAVSLVVTLGRNGLAGLEKGRFFHLPGNPVKEKDAVGCGDTVRSVIALALGLGLSLEEACGLANDAAAVAVQKRGTSVVTPEELTVFIDAKSR